MGAVKDERRRRVFVDVGNWTNCSGFFRIGEICTDQFRIWVAGCIELEDVFDIRVFFCLLHYRRKILGAEDITDALHGIRLLGIPTDWIKNLLVTRNAD